MESEDVLVVGAGPAGLASSACLHREGIPHLVLERAREIAPSWRGHYDRLHLHTTKTYSALPLTPWAAEAPRYPSRDQVVHYLQAYATQHHVAVGFGVAVTDIRRSGNRFLVATSAGALTPRVIVMATGYNQAPKLPSMPGLEFFQGSAIHSGAYKSAAPYKGMRTLVVGCGNSGAEIALDLAEHGIDVAMVVRGPVHVVPRDLFGRPSQHTNILLSHLPLGMRDAIATTVLRLAVGDLLRWGIVRPTIGPNRMIEELGRIPMLDVGTIDMVKRGRIRILPAVQEILRESVRFAGDAQLPFEAIIFATGYTPGLERVVSGFDVIADARGRPDRFGEESAIPGLYFVGFKNPPTGALREIALEAPRVARSIREAPK